MSASAPDRETAARPHGSEERLQILLGCTRGLALELDETGTCLGAWGPADLLVVPPGQLVGRQLREVHPEAQAARIGAAVRRVVESQQPETLEYQLLVPKGLEWFLSDVVPLPQRPGLLRTVALVARNITEKKQLELRLREAEERFQLVSRATNDAVWDWDLVTNALWWNEGFYRLFGYAPADVEPDLSSWTRRLHPEDLGRVVDGIHHLIDGGGTAWTDKYRFLRADGSHADIFDRGYVIRDQGGKPVRMIGAMMDISDRERDERARGALTRIADAAGATSTLDELLESVHRIVAGLLPARNFFIALYRPETHKLEFPYWVDEKDPPPEGPVDAGSGLTAWVLRTGKPLLFESQAQFEEFRRREEMPIIGAPSASWVGVPLKTQERTVGVLVAQSYDDAVRFGEQDLELLQFVSTQVAHAIERREAEEALRRSERRFRTLIENSSDGIAVLAADGTVLYRSAAGARILGHDPSEPVVPLADAVHPDDAPAVQEVWALMLANPGVPFQVTGRARHGNGTWRMIESSIVNLLEDPALRGIVSNFRDVTERRQIEGQLMAADRMVSIGTLAAGVAHEINNPLSYVVANLALLADELGTSGSETAEILAAAQDGAERVRQIVRDLKTFSRADESVQGDIDIHHVLDAVANLSWNEIRHRARLVKDYGKSLPLVQGNEGRLGQVFLNLMVNAAQAMPEGAVARNEIRLCTRSEGSRLIVEVRDTGPGITAEHQQHLFEPFFTTKPVGVGTGLGLFICKNIIASLGGTISVRSTPGEGTLFTVELPVSAGAPAHPAAKAATAPAARKAKILVVDDEPQIGRVIAATLRAHDVEAVISAVDALARLRAGERFDLIICDLMMPQMTGMDFHEAMERELPAEARRIVFLTGGAFTPKARSFLEQVKNQRIDKPFEVAALRALVAERLRDSG